MLGNIDQRPAKFNRRPAGSPRWPNARDRHPRVAKRATKTRCRVTLAWTLVAFLTLHLGTAAAEPPLGSWNPGKSRDRVIEFVRAVTDPSSADYVPPAQRVAVFDHDGTLWSEQPMYFQLLFAIERIEQLAGQHPEWRGRQPFQAVLEQDLEALKASGKRGLTELVMESHAGMTTDQFAQIVRAWLPSARHPERDRKLLGLTYRPMKELLQYLRANGFQTYIVSGGGIEFLRVFAEDTYGVPPAQVIGSTIKTRLEERDGKPVLVRQRELDFLNDGPGKPIAIHKFIGRRPIAAFGNSDGDLEMLQWTAAGAGRHLCAIVHHTDERREWAYDRESAVGRLDEALHEARRRDWVVIDMKRDWATVFDTSE
jgi:phosphoserine phosphatase